MRSSNEAHRAIAQAADAAMEVVARSHRHWRGLRAGKNHFASLERNAKPTQRIGEPGDGIHRRSLHCRTRAGADDLAVLLEHHAGQCEVELARIARLTTEHEHTA